MSEHNAQNTQSQDIMQMNPLEMSEEQIMQRYSTKQNQPAPYTSISDDARNFIQRQSAERFNNATSADNAELAQLAARYLASDLARQKNGVSRGGVGKQGVSVNGLGFGGTGSRSRSFASMTGAKK